MCAPRTRMCLPKRRSIRRRHWSIIMTVQGKLRDTAADEDGLKAFCARVLRLFARRAMKKASNDYPFMADAVQKMMDDQADAEHSKEISIDRCSAPTAEMLQTICAELQQCGRKGRFERGGYFLGRWIYIMDAADDLTDDLLQQKFNPFIQKAGTGSSRARVTFIARRTQKGRTKMQCGKRLCTAAAGGEPIAERQIYPNFLENIFLKKGPGNAKGDPFPAYKEGETTWDPYKVLGVSPSATDEEIKDAYRKLAKKSTTRINGDSPLSGACGREEKEINEAYDTIVSQRKKIAVRTITVTATTTITRTMRVITPGYVGGSSASGFNDVRRFIMAGTYCRRGADLKTACRVEKP